MAEKSKPAVPLTVVEDSSTGHRFVNYTTSKGISHELHFDGEEPWFAHKDLADMFGVTVPAVIQHIQSFMEDGELDASTTKDFEVVRLEGNRQVKRTITHYGLDVAFYVGYRVNSTEGKLFRRWATQMLVQLATKGFVVNKRQLRGETDRLAELRKVITDLRADEANVYAELKTILAMCKDYDPSAKSTNLFFAHFQDRLLYAITGHTSAEIKRKFANSSKPNMGLQTWDEEREYPLQEDALNSKNYLGPLQLEDLNRLVVMVLDFFEDQVKRGWLVTMADAEQRLKEILDLNKRKLLSGYGSIKRTDAESYAKAEYKKFDKERKAARKAKALEELNSRARALGGTSPGKPKKGSGD